jgi:hypothetical protein
MDFHEFKGICAILFYLKFSLCGEHNISHENSWKNKHMFLQNIVLSLHKSFWLSWILFLLIRFLSIIDIIYIRFVFTLRYIFYMDLFT